MSGGSGGISFSVGEDPVNCNIVERTPLNSPQAAVVSGLRQGDQLEVVLTGQSLVAMRPGTTGQPGQIAGSLTPRSLASLLECMSQGREYVAVVLQIRGAFCEVEVRPR